MTDYDGFVILHGSDTMAFTASVLSFMLEGLQKPVILSGSQLPIGENPDRRAGKYDDSIGNRLRKARWHLYHTRGMYSFRQQVIPRKSFILNIIQPSLRLSDHPTIPVIS